MELKGKKLIFLGDSITQGIGVEEENKKYWELLGEWCEADCRGFGISGTRIARQLNPEPHSENDFNHFSTRVEKMDADADVVVVFGGVNDYGHGDAPFGCMNDRSLDTFYGALHFLFCQLIDRYPTARIVIMTPTHWIEEDAGTVRNNGTVRELPLKAYVDAEREVAEYYSLPVLDLFQVSGIQPKLDVQKEYYMPDGIHPNGNGHRRIAECLIGFLRSL